MAKTKTEDTEGIAFLNEKQIAISAPIRQLGGKGTQVTLGVSLPRYAIQFYKIKKGDVVNLVITKVARTDDTTK